MPETGAEKVLFGLGIAIIGVLLAVIVVGRRPSEGASPATPATAPKTLHLTSTSRERTGPETTTVSAPTTTVFETTTLAERRRAALTLRVSARDDTWLSIRRDSITGDVLFEGTLAKGDSRTYTAKQFRVRFGAAANVAATLNGKALPLPGGTYSATIDRNGLGSRSA
jgi:hypothetical protein